MDSLPERLKRAEDELASLRLTANRLSETLSSLRTEIRWSLPREEPQKPDSLPEVDAPTIGTSEPNSPKQAEVAPPPLLSSSPEPLPLTSPEKPVVEPGRSRDLELQLGRVWSVRLGIVLLTTGLVFLSRYTYDHFVRELGPGLRLTIMYLLSFLITGAGLLCERWKSSLETYGRIVAAGGLAAVYYCSFAAHNVEALRVIENPVAASLLLFASAGLFCGMSLWRESRVMLSTSLALAFYSISVNPVSWMACLSALILSAFGIAMMVRHRWVEVGFLVLVGSYFSFFWWQFAVHHGESPLAHWFLPAYWLLFAGTSLIKGHLADTDRHLLFTGLNNSSFFLLFSYRLESGTWMEKHWLFCFVFGVLLVGLAFVSRNRFPEKSRIVHLVKGISVITLGLALLLDGHHLFVALLLEALVLMVLSRKFTHPLGGIVAWGAAILSLFALYDLSPSKVPAVTWIFGAMAWIALGALHRQPGEDGSEIHFEPPSLAASLVALLLLAFGWTSGWSTWHQGLALGISGAAAGAAFLWRPVRRISPETCGIFAFGGLLALVQVLEMPSATPSQWFTVAFLALLSSVAPAVIATRRESGSWREGLHGACGAFLALSHAFLWLALREIEGSDWVRLTTVLTVPVIGTLVASRTRLAAHSLIPFAFYLFVFPTIPITSGAFLFGSLLTAGHYLLLQHLSTVPGRIFLQQALFLMASAFWTAFLIKFFPSPGLPLALTATALFLRDSYFGKWLTAAATLPLLALALLFASVKGEPYEIYLALAPFLTLHLVRSFVGRGETWSPVALMSLLVLWAQLTRDAGSLPLAAVWAVVGTLLLLTGLPMKSRCFRLLGLIMLAASLGHLMIIDVVKLDPLPRIASFLTLGLGLLGLGFVYNRWQDRLKQIL